MKVTFDIDCTPEEARQFLGLPNIAPIQDRMLKEMEGRMLEGMQSLDPETFMKTWMPITMDSWQEMQKYFWAQMGVDLTDNDNSDNKGDKKKANG